MLGVAAKRRFVPLHIVAEKCGYSFCSILLALHHLTGADYTSKVGTKHSAIKAEPQKYLQAFALGNDDYFSIFNSFLNRY